MLDRKVAHPLWMVIVLCVFGMSARADIVNVSDLTDGIPTVQVLSGGIDVTAARVTVLADSTPEFLHFKLKVGVDGNGHTFFTDLFDDRVGGTLSDRIVLFLDPNASVNGDDVKFCSDPALGLCVGGSNIGFDAVETGGFQFVMSVSGTGIGDQVYGFYAGSDVTASGEVPEPSAYILLGTMLGLITLSRKSLRRSAS